MSEYPKVIDVDGIKITAASADDEAFWRQSTPVEPVLPVAEAMPETAPEAEPLVAPSVEPVKAPKPKKDKRDAS